MTEFSNIKPPNKYTQYMGEQIRTARVEAGLSQEELGEKIYRKRLSVYEMETGKIEISAWTLPLLASALNKPISYFYPKSLIREFPEENISGLEHELLIHFGNIWNDDLREMVIQQVKAASDFDPPETILSAIRSVKSRLEIDVEIREAIKDKPKYQNAIDAIVDLLGKLFPDKS